MYFHHAERRTQRLNMKINNIMTDLAPPNALGPVISPGRRCNFFIVEEAITVQTFKHTHCV